MADAKHEIEDIVANVFSPNAAIALPSYYCGRKENLRDACKFLKKTGAHQAIIGMRGTGKTSLGKQVKNFAQSDPSTGKLININFEEYYLPRYLVYEFQCSGGIVNTREFLVALLNGNGHSSLYDLANTSDSRRLVPELNARRHSSNSKLNSESSLVSVYQNFIQTCLEALRRNKKEKILIKIDELDRVGRSVDLGDLVKQLSDNYDAIKLLIIGVFNGVNDLVSHHASANRHFTTPIVLESMDQEECMAILANVEKYSRGKIVFGVSERSRIFEKSRGYPYFVHLLGQHACEYALENMQSYFRNDRLYVERSCVEAAIARLRSGSISASYEHTFKQLLGDDISKFEYNHRFLQCVLRCIRKEGREFKLNSLRNSIRREMQDHDFQEAQFEKVKEVFRSRYIIRPVHELLSLENVILVEPGFLVYCEIKDNEWLRNVLMKQANNR